MSGIQKCCRKFSTWHSTVAVMLVAAGCGGGSGSPFAGPRYPVKGKVMLVDGKPLTAGRIFFAATEPPTSAVADIGSDGTFEFKGPSGDGLPEAKYKVRIAPAAPEGTRTAVKLAFASKYQDEDDSGLTATVTSDASKNQFEFKLETKNAEGPTSNGHRRR
jgi:hypothetical protein